jgi:subtilisin family serine protease
VPATSTLIAERPDKVVAPGYMQLSGTSVAAPVVAGVAAQILALHPTWTPDQVKGALMSTTRPVTLAPRGAAGVGELTATSALLKLTAPANPNLALNRFVVADPTGDSTPVFDSAAWLDVAKNDAAWQDAAWSDAAWASAAWSDAAWLDAAWSDTSFEDAAAGDPVDNAASTATAEDEADAAADPALEYEPPAGS